jgi:peptide/nickel transport system permease protein
MDYRSVWEQWRDIANHLILPTLTYTIVYAGQYTLFMRSAILEIFGEDFILTAKAKGLSTVAILRDHALRNAMLPTVTVVALNLGFTVAGAIEIETVFSWPGLGLTIIDAVDRQDYPMLQGTFLLLAVSVIFANLMADLLYFYLDPRIRVR